MYHIAYFYFNTATIDLGYFAALIDHTLKPLNMCAVVKYSKMVLWL